MKSPVYCLGCWDMEEYARQENIRYAWDQWLITCCEERGGHWWTLHGCDPEPEDQGEVMLLCDHCPANASDLDPEEDFALFGNIRGVNIGEGVHDSRYHFKVPVTVKTVEVKYENPTEGWGSDFWIKVEERF